MCLVFDVLFEIFWCLYIYMSVIYVFKILCIDKILNNYNSEKEIKMI